MGTFPTFPSTTRNFPTDRQSTGKLDLTEEAPAFRPGMASGNHDNPELAAVIPRSMREEPLVMASSAPFANGDGRPRLTSLRRQDRAQIEQCRRRDFLSGDGGEDLWSDFIALAANRRAEVHTRFRDVAADGDKFPKPPLQNPSCRALPTAMQDEGDAIRMGDEDGNTIRQRHRHRCLRRTAEMSVRARSIAKPSPPLVAVVENAVAVNLQRSCQPQSFRLQRRREPHPTAEDRRRRLAGCQVEASSFASGGKRGEAEFPEPWHLFMRGKVHGDRGCGVRRSGATACILPLPVDNPLDLRA